MSKISRGKNLRDFRSHQPNADPGKLRIIGGSLRGRQIEYSGDPVTRPMKDVTREACFNLVGGYVSGKAVFDLFAGTGAIGLEAISRDASSAILIERHIPTLRIIQANVRTLEVQDRVKIESSDTFFWVRKFLREPENWPQEAWVVFCCPPYALYDTSRDELLITLQCMSDVAPTGSLFVVEYDQRFSAKQLPDSMNWQTRFYSPAYISVAHKGGRNLDNPQS